MFRRSMPHAAFSAACALALVIGCGGAGVQWRNHVSLRTYGADLSLGPIDAGELVHAKISRNLHYVSLELDTVFFRELPGMRPGGHVALGVEVSGVLDGDRTLQTVTDVTTAGGPSGFLLFDNVALLQPFLYPGRNVTVTLHFRAATPDEASSMKGRISGAGAALKSLDPRATQALDTASRLFDGVIGAAQSRRTLSWKYSFTLFPADAVIRDKPESLFTAARHILLAIPPAGTKGPLAGQRVDDVLRRLRLRGNRLVWKGSDQEYVETPYVILKVTRYKRYPRPDTDLRRVVRRLETAFERGQLKHARETITAVGEEIVRDPVITATEKNLERTRLDLWRERIAAAEAEQQGEKPVALRAVERQMAVLLRIKELFGDVLEPVEVKDIGFQLATLRAKAEALGKDVAAALAENLRERLEEDRQRDDDMSKQRATEEARVRRVVAARGAAGTGAVEVDAFERAQPGESTEALRARAFETARRQAIQKATGAEVHERFFGTEDARGLESRRVAEELSALLSDALIVGEEIVREGREGAGYRLHLRARVVLRGARTDLGYTVRVKMSKSRLAAGEDVVVRATVTRDSFLYLFSVGAAGEVTLLVPNGYADVPFVRAGESFVFPSTDLAARGVRIKAQLPTGAKESIEQVKAIALRQNVALVARPQSGQVFQSYEANRTLLLPAILRKLATIDPDAWCDDTQRYTITER